MKQTIALACILKNEVKNLPQLMESVRDCFDEIHFTDTGSTDGSIELIQSWVGKENPANSKVYLKHFVWVDDFAAARNASFSGITTDYTMWMDLDDVLHNREKFIEWKKSAMYLGDYWLNTYHYAIDKDGNPTCSFARERVIKNGLGVEWKYFIHEGMQPESTVRPLRVAYAQTWAVKHVRTSEDLAVDKSRNLRIFEKHPVRDSRMTYYYGKELFENQKPLEAFPELMKAISDETLQAHDRIMGIQYAAMCAMMLNQFEKAIDLAHKGLMIAPTRAEFHVIIADSYVKLGKIKESAPFYSAASNCEFTSHNAQQGPVFAHEDSYKHYPLNQLARIWANHGDIDRAERYATQALSAKTNDESVGILKELENIRQKTSAPKGLRKSSSEIVITAPPQGLYEWDLDAYREKGIGGSETAACEMALWLNSITGHNVVIFNPRGERKNYGGVEFRPSAEAPEYFRDNKPLLHIAWRHSTVFSDDPMYVWCHDLTFPGIEQMKFTKIMALSEFHRGFLKGMAGVDDQKIMVTANGIEPNRFKAKKEKEFGKIIYSSSPDRGLDKAILVMDEVVKEFPEAKLHVFYGFDNMIKMGSQAEVDRLTAMINSRPHVVFHGNIDQKRLTEEFMTSCVWLYPTNFLETYCITAIEAICCGTYPVVRSYGALPDTLDRAAAKGMAKLIDSDIDDADFVSRFSQEVVSALKNKSWESVNVDPQEYSWENVARSWVDYFNLGERCQATNSASIQTA